MGERVRMSTDRPGTPANETLPGGGATAPSCRTPWRDIASVLALALALQVGAAVAAPAAKKSVPPKASAAKPPAKPAAAKPAATPVELGATFTSTDLDRVFVGNQAGVLKIYATDKKTVLFTKDAPGTDMKGVDGTQWAPIGDVHRTAIFGALGIVDGETPNVARKIMASYRSIKAQRTGIAMLGVIGSTPSPKLDPTVASEIRVFLSGLLASEKDVSVRRQAVLALALCADTDAPTARSVVTFMGASKNAWETFTTRQFFEYHKDTIRSMPEVVEIRQGIEASGNPYSADIAKLLN